MIGSAKRGIELPVASTSDSSLTIVRKPPKREAAFDRLAIEQDQGVLRKFLETEQERLKAALLAPLTQTGYGFDWRMFLRFCHRANLDPLPASPTTIGLYATHELSEGRKVSTVRRRLSAVSHFHRAAALPSPVTREVLELLRGARRIRGEKLEQVEPLLLPEIRAISAALALRNTPRALRDRAIVVVGFCSALRSANLASLMLEDVEFTEDGVILTIHREKQDQEGKGRLIGMPRGKHPDTCPVLCLRAWLDRRGAAAGPLFTRLTPSQGGPGRALNAEQFCRTVQKCVGLIGLDPRLYGAHSLRSGFVTEAGNRGVGELLIASQTGHRTMSTLRMYFRRRDVFRTNACTMLDL